MKAKRQPIPWVSFEGAPSPNALWRDVGRWTPRRICFSVISAKKRSARLTQELAEKVAVKLLTIGLQGSDLRALRPRTESRVAYH
jgi:hypothetical protein